MNATELYEHYQHFTLDSKLAVLQITKIKEQPVCSISWKDPILDKEEANVTKKDVIEWIEQNKDRIVFK